MLLARLGQWTLAQRAWSKCRISAAQRALCSRASTSSPNMAGQTGLEPVTAPVTAECSAN